MNIKLIEYNYDMRFTGIQLLDSHFGTEIYLITTDIGKYIAREGDSYE